MSDEHCLPAQREAVLAARDALLAHPAVHGGTLVRPGEGPYDAWTLECQVVTDDAIHRAVAGWEPHHQRTAAEHGLTVQRVEPRSPAETRVLLTL